MADQEGTRAEQAAEDDGLHAAIAMVRAYPRVIKDNDERSAADVRQEMVAFQEVARREWHRMQGRHGTESALGDLLASLTRLAAAVADRAASEQGRTREALLDALVLMVLIEEHTRPDKPK